MWSYLSALWINLKSPSLWIKMRAYTNFAVTYPSYRYHGWLNGYYKHITPINTTPLTKQKVIVFVYGKDGDPGRFVRLIENLKPLLSSEYNMRTVDLGDTSETTIAIDAIHLGINLEQYSECEIILVGVSKGGLAIIDYTTRTQDKRICKLITIEAPVRGTEIAKLYPDDILIQEFAPDGPVIKDITERAALLSIPIYHIVNMWDYVVIPEVNAAYATTPRYRIYYDYWPYSHIGETYNWNTAWAIAKFVKDESGPELKFIYDPRS